jgi:hypothetical protein
MVFPNVSTGNTSNPGNGVGEGTRVAVGGIGDGVNVDVGGMGDDVIVGAGDAVGTNAGSAVQPAIRTSSRINAVQCFMMSPLWRIIDMMIMWFRRLRGLVLPIKGKNQIVTFHLSGVVERNQCRYCFTQQPFSENR